MANQEHLDIIKQGAEVWNAWRVANPDIRPDISLADLTGADLRRVNLRGANLSGAILHEAKLNEANLITAYARKAILYQTDLSMADLTTTDLTSADLTKATLIWANLSGTHFTRARLTGANLSGAILIRTDFQQATLSGCRIYGISAWDLDLEGSIQENLVITPGDQPTITVDNLEVAQFIYLLLNNEKIRDVIDTLGKKAVLILGRFTPERKAILDAIREALRQNGYLPILFDFEKPVGRDFTSTVETLARLSRFIIADLSDPRSIPQELASVIPHLRTVPIQPILLASQSEYAMFGDYRAYPWVLATHHYTDLTDLLAAFKERVIDPAEKKAYELTGR